MASDRQAAAISESLTSKVGKGLGWSVANNVIARATNVLVGIVLARILVPEDYGIFAVSLVLINAALSMNELGVSVAVVRWPGSPARIAPTVTTLSILWSAALVTLCWFSAPAVATALGSPTASGVIRMLSLCILIDALAAVPAASLTRAFMQRERLLIDIVCLSVSSGLSIVLALRGYGAWSLAIGLLAASVLSGVLTVAMAPERYLPGFDREIVGELLRFGLPLAGASSLVFLTLNVDYIVVGRELGAEALGFYSLAFNVCSWPVTLLSVAIRRVSLAGFSRVAESSEQEAASAFVRSSTLLLAVSLPLGALLAAYAGPTISVIYGERWLPAARALAILCILGMVRILMELGYDYLTSIGRPADNLVIQGVWFALLIPALALGARLGGIEGVAWAHAAVAVVVILPLFLVLAGRHGVSPAALARTLTTPVVAVALVIASAWLTQRALPSDALALFVGGGVSGLLAAAVVSLPYRSKMRGWLVSRSLAATPS